MTASLQRFSQVSVKMFPCQVSWAVVHSNVAREACYARIPSWKQPCLHYETCLQSFSSKVGLLSRLQVVTYQVALHGITACQKVGSLKILCCSF